MGQIAKGSPAVQCNLKYVKGYEDRHGKWHYYFRKKGRPVVRIPGEAGSVEFLKVYTDLKDGPPKVEGAEGANPNGEIAEGSFEALCRDYKTSAEYSQLSTDWKRDMGYVIKAMCAEHGHKPVKLMARRHIVEMKNKLKHKPGACNKMLRVLKIILNYGVLGEYRDDNPADKVKLMKLGRYRAWTNKELSTFESKWAIGTLERFIFDTALYSGQRAADLVKLKRKDMVLGLAIKLKQKKTGKPMTLRIHANWKASMAAYLPTHKAETLIAGRQGESIHQVTMSDIFREGRRDAGLPDDCLLHGLRKTTARILAELGQKSAPVTGHMTRAMQEEYERDADQEKMAKGAIVKWEGKKRRKAT